MALPRSIESLTIYRQTVKWRGTLMPGKPFQSGNGELHFDARVVT